LLASQGKPDYYTVLDRKSGKPLENVTIKSKDFSLKTSAAGLAIYTRNW
jgi:hypothetical protein